MGFLKKVLGSGIKVASGGLIRDKHINGATDSITDAIGITNRAGDKAAAAQAQAARDANDTTWRMYNQGRQDQEPWRQAGAKSLSELSGQMGDLTRKFTLTDFQQDPGYQFRIDEGQKALERSSAARGGLMGGRTLKELSRYGQDFASNEYTNAYNRFNNDRDQRFNKLSNLAGIGQSSAAQIANQGNQAGQQVSANQIGMGNAEAANIMGQSNRLNSFIGQVGGAAIGGMMSGSRPPTMFSDERLKTDIEPVSQEDLQELKDKIRTLKLNGKNEIRDESDLFEVMAHELAQTKLGKDVVSFDAHGYRVVNTHKLMSLVLATFAAA